MTRDSLRQGHTTIRDHNNLIDFGHDLRPKFNFKGYTPIKRLGFSSKSRKFISIFIIPNPSIINVPII